MELKKHFITTGMLAIIILSLLVPVIGNFELIQNGLFFRNMEITDRNSFFASCLGFLGLFIPVIAGLPSATILCTELNTGYYKNILLRKNKGSYIATELVLGGLASGIATAIPGIVAWLVSLNCKPYSQDLIEHGFHSALGFCWLAPYETALSGNGAILMYILTMFIFGVVWGTFALLCSAFFKNIYITLAMPFLVCFFLHVIFNQLSLDKFSPVNMVGGECVDITSLSYILTYQSVLFVAFVAAYIITMRRRLYNE